MNTKKKNIMQKCGWSDWKVSGSNWKVGGRWVKVDGGWRRVKKEWMRVEGAWRWVQVGGRWEEVGGGGGRCIQGLVLSIGEPPSSSVQNKKEKPFLLYHKVTVAILHIASKFKERKPCRHQKFEARSRNSIKCLVYVNIKALRKLKGWQ